MNDILVSTVRPYLRAFAFVEESSPNLLICSTGFAVITSFAIIPKFAYQFILSNAFMKQMTDRMVGSNYPAVNSSDVCASFFPLPPVEEQHQIADILTSIDEQIDAYRAKLDRLTRLKAALMQRLLTGRTRVRV